MKFRTVRLGDTAAIARVALIGGAVGKEDRVLLSIEQARTKVGVSRRTIYNWLKAGRLQTVRTASGRIRIYEDTLWRKDAPKSGVV